MALDLTDPSQLAIIDPAYWAKLRRIRLQSGVFSFRGRGYQIAPMQSKAQRTCWRKATQGGVTEMYVLKSLHAMIHGIFLRGVLYLFPTNDDVTDFSKSRFNPLIRANPEYIGQFVKPGGKGTDSARLKQIYDAFLYLRGARLTTSVGTGTDEKESTKLRSAPVDCVVFEEMDLMSPEVIEKAKGRMGASPKHLKREVYISNPTLPDAGIDKIFRASDQRHLFRKCEACGHQTCAELSFPGCVKERADGTGYIACDRCGRELSNLNAKALEWVPQERENIGLMEGYHWSQLSSEFNDPAGILRDFNDPPLGNLGEVYRLRLGLPYVAAEDQLQAAQVLECCGESIMPTRHPGPCAMGVDVGKLKPIIVGTRTGRDRYELHKIIKLSKWNDIHDLAERFNVRSAVIDIRPYEDEARRFQAAERYRIFLCQYNESTVSAVAYNSKSGIVKVNRTEALDQSHRIIAEQYITLPRRCKEVDEFVKECCQTAKVLETDKRSGTSIYRYRPVGDGEDHFRHALNYFLLAASGGKIAKVGSHRFRQTEAISEYKVL